MVLRLLLLIIVYVLPVVLHAADQRLAVTNFVKRLETAYNDKDNVALSKMIADEWTRERVIKGSARTKQKLAMSIREMKFRDNCVDVLIDMSDWTVENGPTLAIAFAAAVLALCLARRNEAVHEATDALVFRVPVVGGIVRLSTTAILARSLSILLESGVTLLAALEIVEGLFGNRRVRRIVAEARSHVIRGGTFSDAIRPHREFEPMLSRMASVGEASGTIGTALADVARFHEDRLKQTIRRLGMLMEPVLIVIVGTIVGFVYIAFFLAIFSLAGGR